MKNLIQRMSLYRLIWVLALLAIILLAVKILPVFAIVFQGLIALCFPFFIALILTYVFHPIIEMLVRIKIPRGLSIFILFIVLIALAGFLIFRFAPLLSHQWQDLNKQLPHYQEMVKDGKQHVYDTTPELTHDHISRLEAELHTLMNQILSKIIESVKWLLESLISLLIIPFLCFYFLKDYPKMEKRLLGKLSDKKREVGEAFIQELDRTLGHFLRGQFYVSLFLAILSFFGLTLIHCPSPAFLSVLIGVTDFIPYFGPFLAAIPVFMLAGTQSMQTAIFALLIMIILQLIEGNVLSPLIMGKSLSIHPLWIITVLFISGEIAGVIGMLFAVPLFIIFRSIFKYYKPFIHSEGN